MTKIDVISGFLGAGKTTFIKRLLADEHRTVDSLKNVIVNVHVEPANINDITPMPEILQEIEHRLGRLPKYMGLDAGYHSAWIAHLLETNAIQGVIGYRRHTHKTDTYGKYRFNYNYDYDFYTCPAQQRLYWKTTTREGYRQYFCDSKTCVCASHPGEQEDTHFKLDTSGNIIDTTYELPNPTDYRSLNVFVLKTDLLLSMVEECQAHNAVSWRHDILQVMGKRYRFRAFVWDGYAAKIDSVQSYFEKSMELLRPEIRAELFDPRRPIHAKLSDSASTFIDPDSRCVNSLIADGCDIRGSVKNCILFRGVTVEKGANVENCILFKDTTVHSGAILKNVIADKNVVISENATLMGHEKYPVVIAKNSEV